MKAQPFIEAMEFKEFGLLGENAELNSFKTNFLSLKEFYSQPFTIDILVNPIEKPDMKSVSPNGIKDIEKWQEAENCVLFEGGRDLDASGKCLPFQKYMFDFNDDHFKISEFFDDEMLGECEKMYDFIKPETLNQFISDCNRAELDLKWKQSVIDKYFKT